jgi:ribosomal protein L7Ae-like RNA K-turn-binding protein
MQEKLFNILTMCMKARKLTFGFDSVKGSILDKTAQVVIISSDASAKTAKEVRFFAAKEDIPVKTADFTSADLLYTIGKKAAVTAILDKGFADRITELL